MKKSIIKDCFWCGPNRTHVLKGTFPETDGKGGLILKKEYVCSECGESFITEK